MGEIAALSRAFDTEFNKHYEALPRLAHEPDHDAFLNHYRQVQRIAESIAYYASRLPPYASVHRILAFGDRLAQREEHRLALEACYSYVKHLNIHQRNVVRADELTCLSWHVQACYGVAVCEATLVLHQDPQMKHPDTLAAVVACLHQLKDVLVLVLPSEQLYWLTLNGTLHIYTLAKRLLTAGYVAQMLPFMVFCVKALESHVIFSTSKYLTWRTQLYISLCYAYCDVREHGMAKQVVQEGLSKIDALIKLQKLDPVPAPPEVQAAYRTAKAMLCALKLKLEVICAPSGPGSLSTPEKPTPAKGGGGKGQTKSHEKGRDRSEGGLNELVNAAWQPLLAEVGDTQKAKLTAMLEAMQVPGRRVVRHEPVEGALKDMFQLAHFEATPLVKHLTDVLQEQQWQQEEQQQQHQQQQPHQLGESTAGEGGAAAPGRPGSASSMHSKSAAEGAPHHGHHPHVHSHLHPQAYQRHQFNPPEAEELSLLLHTALLCTAYNFEQGEAVDELLELARLRLARGAVGLAIEGQVAVFSAMTALLGALRQLDTAPGTESLHHLSRTLASVYSVAARVVADVVTDAALVLYAEAKPLLNGVYCKRDQEAELVLGILRTLHACFEAVDLDDAVLRLSVSLKLALLLEEQDGGSTDQLHQARDVLRSTRVVVERFRCEASLMMRGQPHEHLHWITASRNQPNDAVAKLVSGMPDTDQELACLHVDVLSTLYRVELAVGVAEQQAQALFQQAMLAENVKRREAQSSIFGVRTMKERRLDEQRIMQAATTSSNPPLKERELLQACGKNPYEKALALTAMAPLQAEPHRQLAMLQEAALCLTKAQDQEDALFAAAQPEQKGKAAGPLQPKVLHRTPTSCTLTHFPFNLKGNKRVAKYAVYAKVFGAGVALILNKTASEYPGTGAMMPPGTPVTVEGLRTNDTYVFAIAAYDDSGVLIGELGTSSTETLAGLPLPLYHCWAHLLLMACRLRLWPLASHASNVLLPHFIKTGPDRPLWEANPMDAQVIHKPHVEVATRALLRIFVQAVYAHTGAGLSKHEALPATTTAHSTSPPPPLADLRMPYANEQIARLKSVKRLLLATKVAVVLHDEMLIQEGAVRVYHMLGPLLVLKAKSPMIHKALAKTHICLQDIANLVQMSQTGQEALRLTAARVSSAVAYYAIMMATVAREEGSVKFFARLDVELLKAYDPRFSVPGRPPVSELLAEGAALQELLLCHERGSEFAEEGGVIGERMKDEDDVVAGALPFLAQSTPLEVWNHLGRVDVVDHPRWVELMVRAIEASVRKGKLENVEALAGQVMWHVRSKLQCPPIATYPYEPKWDLEAAAADYADVTLEPEEEPPKPDLTSLLDVNTAAEEEAWLAAREAVLMQARRRHAAAALLQRRLPLLLARLRAVREIRQLAMQWAPWMARLNMVLGLAKTYEGRCCVEAALHIKDPPADSPDNPPLTSEEASESDASKGSAATAQKAAKGAPAKGKEAKDAKASPTGAAAPTAATGSAAANAFAATATIPKAVLMAVPLQALLHLARGVQLAVRGQAWHEALNAVRHLWNSTRALVNAAPSLLDPTPALQWELGGMPPSKQPPESLLIAPKEGKGGKGTKKEEPAKAKPGAKGVKPGAKGAPVAGEAPPEPTWPQVPLPQNAQENNIARTLHAAVEALLSLVAAVKAGTPLYTGVIPLADSPRNRPALEAEASGQPRPGSAVSTAYASSNFSFGSDLVAELWFRKTSLDMDWINKFIIMALQVLLKMNRFHTIVHLGKAWMSLCEGHYNEKLLPILINASPLAGLDDAPYKAAMEVVMRDKNQALDNLDKVRLTIRERLGDITLLNHHIGTKIKKKKEARLNHPQANRGASRSESLKGSQADQDFDDQSSLVSMYTYKTQSSMHSKGSQPDFIALPAEYERVIEQLKKRSEKAAMILAIAELGDVHAHFGNWGGATTAWNDALDTLLGPFQAIRHWRKLLDGQSKEQILQQYGVHGCLLAGAILVGKLSRYSYFSSTGQRLEAARLGATLLAPLFTTNITHPQRPVNFATYVPRAVWDGVDLFSDAYKCNVTDLQSGLEGIASILMEAGLSLDALPIISLWEHLTLHVMRNLKATVTCRLMRARALVLLGLMSEASEVLVDLIRGARLPDPTLDTDYVVKNEDGSVLQISLVPPFSNRKYPGDPANRAALTFIGEGPLPGALEKLYGSWAVAHLALARAGWLTKLGSMPNLWKACHPSTGREATPDLPLPDPIEPQLLSWASTLINRALAMAHGKPLPPESGREASAGPAAKTAKAGAKPAAAPDKKKEDKKGAAAAASAAPPSPIAQAVAAATAAAAAEPSRFLQDAQRAHVMVHALLHASKVALLQWQPLRALQHAMEATRFMGSGDESSVQGGPLLEENDEVDRLAIRASMWMAARLQTVKCLVQLRHARPCYALVAAALKEAELANDGLAAVQLLHVQGQMQEVEGQTADALNTYNDVIARYQSLALRCDLRAAEALSDAASLRDRLGLRQDSVRLGQAASNMLESWVRSVGLQEMKEHPELINIYSEGTTMFVRALLHMGRCCSRARDHRGAAKHFAHAFSLLRVHTRALPSQHAAAALALGRALKHVVLLEPLSPGDLPPTLLPLPIHPQPSTDPPAANAPPPVGAAAGRNVSTSTPRAGSPPQKGTAAAAAAADGPQAPAGKQQLHESVGSSPFAGAVAAAIASGAAPGVASPSAPWIGLAQDVLHQALILAALDGGHLRQIMRAALLELGSLYMACALPRCGAACLAYADAVSSKADTLMLANHMLAPVAVDKMPEWAKEYVKGQEDAFVAQQDNKAAAPSALADADLGRMLVCHFLSLMRASSSLPADEAMRAEAQMIYLHSSLLTACPRYASDACFSSVPLPLAIHEAAPALAPGRVILQWYPQDGCWQSDRSWQMGGSLGLSSHVTDKDVLNLQPVAQFTSLLYAVVNQRGTVRTGELTFEVPAVRGIQRRVKELRNRCESPKAPTDLFGYDAPTARELAGIRTASERFLGMRRVSEDGGGWGASLSPHDSEDLDAPSTTGPASTTEGGSPVPSPAPRSSTQGAVQPGRGGAKGAAAASKPEPVGPPPTDLNFLVKLEALLALEGGLDLVDPSLAEWLFTVLPSE